MKSTELAAALFRAFEEGDEDRVRELCAPDLRARQNQGPVMGLEELIAFSRAVLHAVEGFRYEEAQCRSTEGGFVEEHVVRAALPDGSELSLPVCVVAEVSRGRVNELREYVDGVAAAPLLRALSVDATSAKSSRSSS